MSSKEKTFFDNLILSQLAPDDTGEFIQLNTDKDGENFNEDNMPNELSLLPVRNTVLFPGVVMPITVGRNKSMLLFSCMPSQTIDRICAHGPMPSQ